MRHILVDYACSKQTQKRGDRAEKVTLEDHSIVSTTKPQEIVALDDALEQLARLDERKAQVVEMRFFGGLITDKSPPF